GSGLYLYLHLGSNLAASLDRDLRLRAQDLAALVSQPHVTLANDNSGRFVEPGESYVQVLTPEGRVVAATRPLGRKSLLSSAELQLRQVESMRRRAAAISGETLGERLPVPPTDDEIQRLGETLNEMLDRLESALEREREFVADAGHELRTPLALLRTELELALRQARTTDELRAAVRRSSHEADRLAQLAEDLLLITRTEQGLLPLRIEPVDPSR